MYHIGMKSIEQLLALINDTNSLTLTTDDVSFGAPVALTEAEQAEMENPANTKVEMIAKPNRMPIGRVTVDYDRIDLAEFETLGDPSQIELTRPLTYTRLLNAFNSYYGAALELSDINTDTPLPEEPDTDEVLELKASTTSLAYRGDIVLGVKVKDVPLNTVIKVTNLTGLKYAKPARV